MSKSYGWVGVFEILKIDQRRTTHEQYLDVSYSYSGQHSPFSASFVKPTYMMNFTSIHALYIDYLHEFYQLLDAGQRHAVINGRTTA